MFEFGFGHRFHNLNYFEVRIFFHIPLIHYLLQDIITKLCGKTSLCWNFIVLNTSFR